MTIFERTFINYCSLGWDARVGFGFDKKRSGNRNINKCIYFWEGLKKMCCRKTITLNQIIESVNSYQLDQENEKGQKGENVDISINENDPNFKNIFKARDIAKKEVELIKKQDNKDIKDEKCKILTNYIIIKISKLFLKGIQSV
jgi:hypothetical protein